MKKAVWYLKWIILFLVLIGADQMTKGMAEEKVSNEGKRKLYYISAEFRNKKNG